MRVDVVDPSAYTPPYDHALCQALAAAGAEVELITSRFSYGSVPAPSGYRRRELFYRRAHGRRMSGTAGRAGRAGPRSKAALALKLVEHVPGMMHLRHVAQSAEIVHFQWLTVQPLDRLLLPHGRPLVLTAHDVVPREARPGQLRSLRSLYRRFDAIVVHSQAGRQRLIEGLGVDAGRVHVIPHGVFDHLTTGAAPGDPRDGGAASGHAHRDRVSPATGPPQRPAGPVVLFFGLLRPYKGLDVLLGAWRSLPAERRSGAELWIAGMPRMDLASLGLHADGEPEGVRLAARFIDEAELSAWFQQADLVVLPYREADQSGVLFTSLAFGKPLLLSDVGGFPEIARTGAAEIVPAGDAGALAQALARLLSDPARRAEMAAAVRALGAPGGAYSWRRVAEAHLELYERLL